MNWYKCLAIVAVLSTFLLVSCTENSFIGETVTKGESEAWNESETFGSDPLETESDNRPTLPTRPI